MNALERFKKEMRELAGVTPYEISMDPYGFTTTLSKVCPVTKEMYTVEIDTPEWLLYKSGVAIQEAIPDLTPQQAEFVISHYTPAEYDQLMDDIKDE